MRNIQKRKTDEDLAARKGVAEHIRETREMRENLTERQIDDALKDTFPASDPPSWY